MEHYHKLYAREITVSEEALNVIPRLQIIEELDIESSMNELEKAITSQER